MSGPTASAPQKVKRYHPAPDLRARLLCARRRSPPRRHPEHRGLSGPGHLHGSGNHGTCPADRAFDRPRVHAPSPLGNHRKQIPRSDRRAHGLGLVFLRVGGRHPRACPRRADKPTRQDLWRGRQPTASISTRTASASRGAPSSGSVCAARSGGRRILSRRIPRIKLGIVVDPDRPGCGRGAASSNHSQG